MWRGGMAHLLRPLLRGRLPLGSRLAYLGVAVLANSVNAVLTYPLYRMGVFRTGGSWLAFFARFYVVCFCSLVFNLVGLPLPVGVGRAPVLLAQALLVLTAPLIKYQLTNFWA